jgi:hypothetical protein
VIAGSRCVRAISTRTWIASQGNPGRAGGARQVGQIGPRQGGIAAPGQGSGRQRERARSPGNLPARRRR